MRKLYTVIGIHDNTGIEKQYVYMADCPCHAIQMHKQYINSKSSIMKTKYGFIFSKGLTTYWIKEEAV